MVPLKLTATQSDALTLPRLPSISDRKQWSISVSPCYRYPGSGGLLKSKVRFPICSIQNAECQAVVDNHERSSIKKVVPDWFSSIKPKHVKLVYHYLVSNSKYLLLVPLVGLASTSISTLTLDDIIFLWSHLIKLNSLVPAISSSALLGFLGAFHLASRPKGVYLVDYSCYKPEPALKSSKDAYINMSIGLGTFSKEAIAFQRRLLERSGIGDQTYIPKGMVDPSMVEARNEAEIVMFGAIDELLKKAGIKAEDIGILVVNCSLFNPTPSLSAMTVNHYKLKSSILSYNLGGMGCSAGIISIDLANQLLQVHPNSYALVVSTENITQNLYYGNDRSMLVSNCLFRMGGTAVLLSNRPSDRRRSKYELLHVVRTHMGANDRSYNCITQREDDADMVGVSLSKELMSVAGEALKMNITTLGPRVLPLSEQLLFLATQAARKLFGMKKIKPYVPDFKLAFEHFCIHAGGKAVLDEIEKSLELTSWHMEPSKMTLYRYGNTSSSSVWYELAYTEAKGRIKKGDRAWQIGFGSGFKCNSTVWRTLRTINPAEETNPWMDEIDEFPVRVSKLEDFAHHSSK